MNANPSSQADNPGAWIKVASLEAAGVVDERMLVASRRIVGFLVKMNSTDFPVTRLAKVAGLSERTFYRYFPRKEDVIRPALQQGEAQFVELLAARNSSESLMNSLVHAFGQSDWAQHPARSRTLRKLVHENPGMHGVWLQIIAESEVSVAAILARRLCVSPESRLAKLAASVVFVAIRYSIDAQDARETEETLQASFARNMELIGSHIFTSQ